MKARVMTEKVAQSRENAAVALEAYRATGGQDPDDLTCIGDLLADLLHLAEAKYAEAEAEEECEVAVDGQVTPAGLAYRAIEHWEYESDPEHADEGV